MPNECRSFVWLWEERKLICCTFGMSLLAFVWTFICILHPLISWRYVCRLLSRDGVHTLLALDPMLCQRICALDFWDGTQYRAQYMIVPHCCSKALHHNSIWNSWGYLYSWMFSFFLTLNLFFHFYWPFVLDIVGSIVFFLLRNSESWRTHTEIRNTTTRCILYAFAICHCLIFQFRCFSLQSSEHEQSI